jgi:predicted 2-oxoglutarate/Fe(II)-dependent dioxygenase YbiX
MIIFKQKILFTEEECELILKKYIDTPINKIEDTDTMKYKSKDIDYNVDKWILDRFINWVENELNIKIELSNSKEFEFYLQSYKAGDLFVKHIDNSYNRVFACGLLLNNTFKGGEFVVYTPNDEIMLFNNTIGNCYLFEANLAHEVKEIIEGNRSVILIFFRNSQITFKRNKLL